MVPVAGGAVNAVGTSRRCVPEKNSGPSFRTFAQIGSVPFVSRPTQKIHREALINRNIVGIFVSMGIVLAASAGAARAQNSTGGAGIDAALRDAVERKDVPGVVALVTDRKGVLYQGAFGVADVVDRTRAHGRRAVPHRVDDQGDHLAGGRCSSSSRAASVSTIRPKSICRSSPDLKVFESFDPATGDYRLRPASRPADRAALPDPHVRARLSVHQRDLARFQAARGRDLSVRRPLAVRARRALALQHEHRRGRQAGRGSLGPEARGLFPPAHLRPAQDGRHLLQRAAGQGAAPRRRSSSAPATRMDGADRPAIAAARAHHSRRRSAAAALPRPRATTAASCACCSTAASSTARAC